MVVSGTDSASRKYYHHRHLVTKNGIKTNTHSHSKIESMAIPAAHTADTQGTTITNKIIKMCTQQTGSLGNTYISRVSVSGEGR